MKQKIKEVYVHFAQWITNSIPARLSINIWGRGTGKTYGVTAIKALLNVLLMPGSVGAIGCPSFQHMMEHIFPQIVKAWEALGYVEGRDFVCFEKPPKGFKHAIVRPRDYKRCIFFRNGSAIKLFSFNYNSLSNGESIDWIIIDEARLCKESKIAESLKCLRGNEEHFGHLSIHKSVVYVTDMPRTPSEFWLLRYQEQENKDRKASIEELAEIRAYCHSQSIVAKTKKERDKYKQFDQALYDELNEQCKELTYLSFASSLENIYALKIDTIKNWERTSASEADFDIPVLNIMPKAVDNCYYAGLDKDKHGYITPYTKYNDYINYRADRNCLWDGDIDESQSLFIAMDYNADITSLLVGQLHGRTIKLLKVFYVTHPQKRADVVKKFADYYSLHQNKDVIYFYDNTAKARDADKDEKETFAVRTINELIDQGYNVTPINLSQTTQENRYDIWGDVLNGGTEKYNFNFQYNIENAAQFEFCASRTQTKIQYKDHYSITKKDKSSEKSRKVAPQDATHITEAADTLLIGLITYYTQYFLSSIEI